MSPDESAHMVELVSPFAERYAATAAGFWGRLGDVRDASLAGQPPEDPHARHRKRPTTELLKPESHGGCPSCGQSKLRYMLAQPAGSHVRTHGERIARRFGVVL